MQVHKFRNGYILKIYGNGRYELLNKRGKVIKTGSYRKNKVVISKIRKQLKIYHHDPEKDKKRIALKPGWRISKNGKLYFENRINRSDRRKYY